MSYEFFEKGGDERVTENIQPTGGYLIENAVEETVIPMTEEDRKLLMADYRKRHPEQFFGTPEWKIRVSVEIAGQVYEETGIRFVPF